jgi:hypothetical protein
MLLERLSPAEREVGFNGIARPYPAFARVGDSLRDLPSKPGIMLDSFFLALHVVAHEVTKKLRRAAVCRFRRIGESHLQFFVHAHDDRRFRHEG